MSTPPRHSTPPIEPPSDAFEVTERVRWEDVDLVGIMRYSAYTRLFDVAESDLLRSVDLAHPRILDRYGVWMPRRVLHLEYHAPARLDALLRIRIWTGRIGRTSVTAHFDVRDESGTTLHANGHLVLVAVDAATFQPRDVPAEVVERLTSR